MQPADGAALKALMEGDPVTPGQMSMTTEFLIDPYQAWAALKPDMVGVVAEAPDDPGQLIGSATVAFDPIQYNGQALPSAFLENLKVHHAYRGRGLGTQLAQRRVAIARERFGDQGVILTGTTADNTASLATMKKWCNQFAGPVVVVPYMPRSTAPDRPDGLSVRSALADELPEVIAKTDQFYSGHSLYVRRDAKTLERLLNGTPRVYHYRLVVDVNEQIVAGALISDRSTLLIDKFRNVPPPVLEGGMVPPDLQLRSMEVGCLWFEQLTAGQYLWESIRWEFRERVNSISMGSDARSPVQAVLGVDHPPVRIEIIVALNAPSPLDADKPISNVLRG
jgi:GNAT superfamily N-acetyltransferase